MSPPVEALNEPGPVSVQVGVAVEFVSTAWSGIVAPEDAVLVAPASTERVAVFAGGGGGGGGGASPPSPPHAASMVETKAAHKGAARRRALAPLTMVDMILPVAGNRPRPARAAPLYFWFEF